MELENKKINFIGDSITEGCKTSGEDKIYLNVIKKRQHLAEARNYGIGGSRIARQSNYLTEGKEFAFVDRFYKMDDDADIIVVFGGTNDYGHGDAMIGHMDDRTPNTFCGACHLLFEGLIKKYPTSTIVVMTPLQRTYPYHEDLIHPSKINVPLAEFVRIIKEIAAFYAIPVLDLYSVSGIHPQIEINRINYCPDGLHPGDAGHELIASRLTGFLKSL